MLNKERFPEFTRYVPSELVTMLTRTQYLRVIHKPRGELRGSRGWPNDHFITSALFSKVTTKEGGGSKIPKILTTWFMDDPFKKSEIGNPIQP